METLVQNSPRTPDGGWRVHQLNHCVNDKQNKDKYLSFVMFYHLNKRFDCSV